MFTQVRLSNFKSFLDDHEIDLRRISVFIGPNGSGKSSALQALLLWRQSLRNSAFTTTGPFIDLGGAADVQISGQPPASLGLTVTKSIAMSSLSSDAAFSTVEGRINGSFELGSTTGSFVSLDPPIKLEYSRSDQGLAVEPDRVQLGDITLTFDAMGNITSPLRHRGGTNLTGARQEAAVFIEVVSTALETVRYVPALRGFSQARYLLRGQEFSDFAQNIDSRQNADALTTTIIFNDELREELSSILNKITGVTIDRELSGDGNSAQVSAASLRSTATGRAKRVVTTNEGFGTNQLIHLISQVLVTPAGGTVLVEEPEAHLHPFGQFELANFVADHSNVNNRQFLITTHSERFLAGLLWQVRQEVLDPSDIIVHYFTLDEDGHSVHQRKGVTHGGIVEGSFREFFPPPDVPDWEEFFRGLG